MRAIVSLFVLLGGCKLVDKVTDAVDGGPQTSYCEAVCDWAVTCHSADRELDAAAVTEACLAATRASDPDCALAEGEGLPPEDSLAVTECTEAIAEKTAAGECAPFTGNEAEVRAGIPPVVCGTLGVDAQATFDAARDATQEGGAELCVRFSTTWCERVTGCLLGDYELPDAAIDAVGEPQEICEARLAAIFTDDCVGEGLYEPPVGFTDINTARMAAQSCMNGVGDLACGDLFSGSLPPVCAGAFSSPDQLADFATGLLGSACEFADFVPGLPCGG